MSIPGAPDSQPESRLDELRDALIDSAGLDKLPAPEPLIDGLLFSDSLAWLHGKPGHCKSRPWPWTGLARRGRAALRRDGRSPPGRCCT